MLIPLRRKPFGDNVVQNSGTKWPADGVQETPVPALPSHTYKTRYGYQFRIVVPEQLRQSIGKREIKKSLGNDYRAACAESYRLSLETNQLFESVRAQVATGTSAKVSLDEYLQRPLEKRFKVISEVSDDLVTSLKQFWLATLDADLARRREGLDDTEYDELQQNIEFMKKSVGRALATGDVSAFMPVINTLLVGRGYLLKVPPEQERLLVLDVLPALQEGCAILAERQQGNLVKADYDPAKVLPAVWQEPQSAACGLSWDSLFEVWKQDRERPIRTVMDAESYIKCIQQRFPKSTPETFTRAMASEWLRQERDLKNNKMKTLEKKGTLVGAIFSIGVKDELLEKNPFEGFDYKRFAAKVGVEDNDDRLPFSDDQLKRIFSTTEGLFSPKISRLTGGGGYYARAWFPLLALFSGARLDEIGSLTVRDVAEFPVPHFRVTKGKTQSSLREVPLHPELIRLGFLDYVKAIREAGHQRLWPWLKAKSAKVKDSEVLGKWFNGYLHKRLKFPSTVVFHSFRHNFKDLCRNALISRDIHDAISGHEDGERKNVGDSYGRGYSVETKYREICKITLDLALVAPKPFEGAVGDGSI